MGRGGNLGVRCEERGWFQKGEFGLDSLVWEPGSCPGCFAGPLDSKGTRANPPFPSPELPPTQFLLLSAKLEMACHPQVLSCVTCCDLLISEP